MRRVSDGAVKQSNIEAALHRFWIAERKILCHAGGSEALSVEGYWVARMIDRGRFIRGKDMDVRWGMQLPGNFRFRIVIS